MYNNYVLDYAVEQNNGNIYYLGFNRDREKVNLIASPMDLCLIDRDNGLKVPGFGSICLSYNKEQCKNSEAAEWLEFSKANHDEDRYVHHDGIVTVEKNYIYKNNILYMEIKIKNLSDSVVEVDELSISTPVNNYYTELRYEQEYMYNYRACEHIYPGGTCGYQIIQTLNGEPPFMYVLPQGNTVFEHAAHLPGTTAKVRENIRDHSWPGSSIVFIHARGYMERNEFHTIMGKDSVTSVKIPPNGEINYGIEIGFVNSIEEFKKKLIQEGKIFATPVFSMISPVISPVYVSVYSLHDIFVEESENFSVQESKRVENGYILKIKFHIQGEHFVKIRNDKNHFVRLVFNIISPLDELLEKRVKFILNNQIFNCEGHTLDGAILPYSARPYIGDWNRKYEKGLFAEQESIWGNGSYEGGITEAMFIAQKNVLLPDSEQVRALETYVKKYVRRYLQNPENNEVIWWCVEFHYTRAFDYMHLANFYYSMYSISSRYNLTVEYSAKEYLAFAFNTLMKMYEVSRIMDMVVGLMGGQNIFRILESMQKEDMVLEYYELITKVHEHRRKLFDENIPYGSECAYDNTGYECVMSFAEYYKDVVWMRKISEIILGTRGLQPVWWWHGSDVRWWDSEPDFSECCLHYTSPLNSSALLMAINRDALDVSIETLSSIYGGILGAFSKIHPDGSGSMSYCWEQESTSYGFHPFSGDIGLGLYGALLNVGPMVYFSGKAGTIGFLCNVIEERQGNIVIVQPLDNIGKKISWISDRGSSEIKKPFINGKLEVSTGNIETMKIDLDLKTIEVDICYNFSFAHQTEILIQCPAGYKSTLQINGEKKLFSKKSEGVIGIRHFVEEGTKDIKLYLKI